MFITIFVMSMNVQLFICHTYLFYLRVNVAFPLFANSGERSVDGNFFTGHVMAIDNKYQHKYMLYT